MGALEQPPRRGRLLAGFLREFEEVSFRGGANPWRTEGRVWNERSET